MVNEQASKFYTALRALSQLGGRFSLLALCANNNYVYIETATEDEIVELIDSLQKNPQLLRLVELLARAGAMQVVQPIPINAKPKEA